MSDPNYNHLIQSMQTGLSSDAWEHLLSTVTDDAKAGLLAAEDQARRQYQASRELLLGLLGDNAQEFLSWMEREFASGSVITPQFGKPLGYAELSPNGKLAFNAGMRWVYDKISLLLNTALPPRQIVTEETPDE